MNFFNFFSTISIIAGTIAIIKSPHLSPNPVESVAYIKGFDTGSFNFSVKAETYPTIDGPNVHPISPPTARKANIAGDASLQFCEQRLKVPGHIIPAARPFIEQLKSDIIGFFANTVIKYVIIARIELKVIIL